MCGFWSIPYHPLESFVASLQTFFGAFFVAYNSRCLLFSSTLCSGDIAAFHARSQQRLHSFGHVTTQLMVYPKPIYLGMTL
jgi:hypothetical protein